MNKRLIAILTSTCLSALLAAPLSVLAQNGNVIEEVVVTAQKRQQNLNDVGISIAVVGEEEIRDRRITMVEEIHVFTPNATVKNVIPGLMPILTVRGVGLNDFNAANNPAIGVYVDEVSLSSLALLSSDLYDLERMEVLKGPQGTLYGRNSTAGALNVVTAKPDPDGRSARISAGAGDYELFEVEGMFNTPLTDTLALRVAGKVIDQGEGFWENDFLGRDVGERDVWMARAQLLWEPTDRTSVLFKIDEQDGSSETGTGNFAGAVPSAFRTDCPNPECMNFAGYTDTDGDIYRGSFSADPTYNLNQTMANLRIDSDFDFGTLTAITGFIDFDREYSADVDASPLAILDFYNDDEVKQVSQEIRLSGESGSTIWQVGVFYTDDEVTTTYFGDLPGILNTTTFSLGKIESTNFSVFANAEWALSDTLTLITGIRYSDEERDGLVYTDDLVSLAPASFLSFAPLGSGPVRLAFVDDTVEDDSVDWKLGLNWQVADEVLVYASASQGTKSGGFFTGVVTSDAQLIPYDAEQLIAYELGIKGQAADMGLSYEAAVFYYDYEDVQTFIGDNSGAVPVNRLGNVSGASIYGLDLFVQWRPPEVTGLTLSAGFGFLDTELDSFVSGADVIPKGNEQPDAPEFSTNLNASYEFEVGDGASIRIAADGRYQDETFRGALNEPFTQSEDYWVINARVTLYLQEGWEFTAWGKNIADDEHMTQFSNNLALGNGSRVHGAPRTWGFTATKHFDRL
ncbi:MAG: TonB-dependent receptor [Pseudomonadota bacterium]